MIFYRDNFGFAKDDNPNGSDVFVSNRELVKSGINNVVAGQRISFDVAPGTRGPRAVDICLID
jgi:cold shock CspA family protein